MRVAQSEKEEGRYEAMSDLISRSTLIDAIVNRAIDEDISFGTVGELNAYLNGMASQQNAIIDLINNQPTIEAVPVVDSEWVICEDPTIFDTLGNPDTYVRCKNCGFKWTNMHHIKQYFKRCPNCGAKMKGGAE